MVYITTFGYFVAVVWYIICEQVFLFMEAIPEFKNLTRAQRKAYKSDNLNCFFYEYNIDKMVLNRERFLFCFYFAITSLTTVGFGDLHPLSDFERLACSFIFIFGTAIFSYV